MTRDEIIIKGATSYFEMLRDYCDDPKLRQFISGGLNVLAGEFPKCRAHDAEMPAPVTAAKQRTRNSSLCFLRLQFFDTPNERAAERALREEANRYIRHDFKIYRDRGELPPNEPRRTIHQILIANGGKWPAEGSIRKIWRLHGSGR